MFSDILNGGKKQEPAPQAPLMPDEDEGFDSIMRSSVSNLLMELVQPWFARVLNRYSEQDFHERIAAGFDFHSDWLANHRDEYTKIIKRARRVRWAIKINPDRFTAKQVGFLQGKGWTLTNHEVEVIRKAILDVTADIEGDHPI